MNENEFAEAVQRQRKKLYAIALMYLGGEADALEAVDEAVYRALVSLKRLRLREYFTTWLTRILINVCKDELKRRARISPMDTLPEAAAEEFDALPLKDAIARLPAELREVLVTHHFGDLRFRKPPGHWVFPRARRQQGSGGPWSFCGLN